MSTNPTSADVRDLLERAAAMQAPMVDPEFADRLERRLRAVHESVTLSSLGTAAPSRPSTARRTVRRLAKLPLTALVAMVVAATAATAAVVVPVARHLVHRDEEPAATTVVTSTTFTGVRGLIAPATTVRLDVPPSTEVPTGTNPVDTVAASGAVDFGADEVPAALAPDAVVPAPSGTAVARPVRGDTSTSSPTTTVLRGSGSPDLVVPPSTLARPAAPSTTRPLVTSTSSSTPTSTSTTTSTTTTIVVTTTTTRPPEPTTTREPATTTRPPEPSTTVATGEVRTSVPTFPMTCTAGLRAITCTWSGPAPAGSTYRLLRSEPGGTVGRVLTPASGSTSYEDPTVIVGGTYVYLLQAVGSTGTVMAQSTPATVTCCRV